MEEEEIRPQKIFDRYLELAKLDTEKYFKNVPKVKIRCPACLMKGEYSFTKNGFDYTECHNCSTLYVSPRPNSNSFEKFYKEASSVKYWATTFYNLTADARREKIWKPKVKIIYDLIKKVFKNSGFNIIDIGGGYGIFAEEFNSQTGKKPIIIEPSPFLAEICRRKDFYVIEKFLEDVKREDLLSEKKVFVSFELFEHLHSPECFLKNLKKLMSPEDIFIFTTLSGLGVDILGLWDSSKSVSPPHHLNFLNPFSIKIILERLGFSILDISTPGKLDLDILSNNTNKIKDNFLRKFVKFSTTEDKKELQKFISKKNWSSHMMVCCSIK